jgi:hypothetical protein
MFRFGKYNPFEARLNWLGPSYQAIFFHSVPTCSIINSLSAQMITAIFHLLSPVLAAFASGVSALSHRTLQVNQKYLHVFASDVTYTHYLYCFTPSV